MPSSRFAQRRPERQPRLHVLHRSAVERAEVRSTKAGASTPATHEASASYQYAQVHAQRRPERQPRLHPFSDEGTTGDPMRAQRRPERQPRLHDKTRAYGLTQTVAQRRPERQPRLHPRAGWTLPTRGKALNEGRSVNPGYTGLRAGARACRKTLNEGRSVNPGYTWPFQY